MGLRKLIDNVYIIPGFANIGVINVPEEGQNNIYLIDSGPDREYAIKICQMLDKKFPGGYKIKAVINTHGHADHTGGNHYFQSECGAEIWIPQKEAYLVHNLNSHVNVIWGGDAIPEVSRVYGGKESYTPTKLIKPEQCIRLYNNTWVEIADLRGHCIQQIGIIYKGSEGHQVFFTGDAFLGIDELLKVKVSYHTYPVTALKTLVWLQQQKADFFVPSHGMVPADDDEYFETTQLNIIYMKSNADYLLEKIKEEDLTTEELVAKSIMHFKIRVKVLNYALIHSTIKSLLSELYEQDLIGIEYREGYFYWTSK